MKSLFFVVMLALSGAAFATPGNNGEGNGGCGVGQQTNGCGAQGGAGGNGGNGGDGGSVFSDIRNTNTNINNNMVKGGTGVGVGIGIGKGGNAKQSQDQGQLQSQQQFASSLSTSGANANNSGNSQSIVVNEAKQLRQAPAIAAPAMSNTANCRASHSAGVSAPGFGISVGSSTVDETCELIELSKRAEQLGLSDVAVQLMCLNPKFKTVAGPLCIE